MTQLIFAIPIAPGAAEREAVLLARSIRAFGGALAENAIWALTPDPEALSGETRGALRALSVELLPFAMDAPARLPICDQGIRCGPRGTGCTGHADLLAWLDSDTLSFGSRRRCCSRATRRWPAARSTTCASGQLRCPARPVLASGLRCVRGARGSGFSDAHRGRWRPHPAAHQRRAASRAARTWSADHMAEYLRPGLSPAGLRAVLRAERALPIFVHQAILSGTALSYWSRRNSSCCRGATTTRCICMRTSHPNAPLKPERAGDVPV